MSNFWDLIWLMVSTFVFIAYLIIMFQIVVDLFRDAELGGGSKVLWIIGLIVLPFLTAIVYIVARGKGMAARQVAAFGRTRVERLLLLAEPPSVDQHEVSDKGTINQEEYAKLKAKALA